MLSRSERVFIAQGVVSLIVVIFALGGCISRGFATEPIAFFYEGRGWAQFGSLGYSSQVIMGSNNLPVGVFYSILSSEDLVADDSPTRHEPYGPWRCQFMGVGWVLTGDVGYSAKFLLGPDRSLLGISFRVWNNSMSHPLVLLKRSGSLPFYCLVNRDGKLEDVPIRNPTPMIDWQHPEECVEWNLPPRQMEEVFVPIRNLLPEGFLPTGSGKVVVGLDLNVVRKSTDYNAREPLPDSSTGNTTPSFLGVWMRVTDASFSIDLKEALKQAQALEATMDDREFGDQNAQKHTDRENIWRPSGKTDEEKPNTKDRKP